MSTFAARFVARPAFRCAQTLRASRNMSAQAVKVGDALPSCKVFGATPKDEVDLAEYVKDKTVVLFGVPGAFTPGCSKTHLPGYISMADEFKAAGVDELICTSVNDPFVMAEWGKAQKADGKVTMLADTQSNVAKNLDIVLDAEPVLGSKRMKRFSMIVQKGTVKSFNVEADNTGLACSLADVALGQVKELK